MIEFDDVVKQLALADGWLAGFGVSTRTSLPELLSKLENAEQMGQLTDDFIYPSRGGPLDARRIILAFDQPLPADARISYAAARNAQYGPYRRWRLEFGGVKDESDHQAPAFVLTPIGEAQKRAVSAAAKLTSFVRDDWQQIAVNCVGRFPDAVTSPKAEAGIEQDEWRQSYWTPASAGLVPNLFDKGGSVTPVNFHTGVWYMSPYFRELKNGDDALMASWCKHKLHAFSGLTPRAKYDLAIYLLQGPPRKKDDNPPSHHSVRISILHTPEGKKRKDAKIIAEHTARVPATGTFDGHQVATKSDEPANVVLMPSILVDGNGRIEVAIETAEQKGGRIKWGETTLAGIQIRTK